MTLKNQTNTLKTEINLKQKMNSPYQMDHLTQNIDCFGSLNQC